MVMEQAEPGAWGDLPLVVITAGPGGDPVHGQRLANLSEMGRHVSSEGGGHYLQYSRPDLVVDVIRGMLQQIRTAPPEPEFGATAPLLTKFGVPASVLASVTPDFVRTDAHAPNFN